MDRFDLSRFREQIELMKKMGSMRDLMRKIPGIGHMGMQDLEEIDADACAQANQGDHRQHDPGRAA